MCASGQYRPLRAWRPLLGGLLSIFSLLAAIYGSCALLAQKLYHDSKYGAASSDEHTILKNASRSVRLYPFNYRFCILAAETAYYASFRVPNLDAKDQSALSTFWCEKGLTLNQYQRELRWLMAQHLFQQSPAKAIAYWVQYVDWDFWSPYNHASLGEMYAQVGDFDNAEKNLHWAQGSAYYDHANQVIAVERRRRSTQSEMEGRRE